MTDVPNLTGFGFRSRVALSIAQTGRFQHYEETLSKISECRFPGRLQRKRMGSSRRYSEPVIDDRSSEVEEYIGWFRSVDVGLSDESESLRELSRLRWTVRKTVYN